MFLFCSYGACTVTFSKFSALSGRATEPNAHKVHGDGRHHYDPNQPRVPEGYRAGGQWTSGSYGPSTKRSDKQSGVEVAANDPPTKPPRGPRCGWGGLFIFVAAELIRSFLERERRPDAFNHDPVTDKATVAVAIVDGQPKFGTNSGHHNYKDADWTEADRRLDIM